MTGDGGQAEIDRIIDAINDPRRRSLLYYLQENERAEIEEVARWIASQEAEGADEPPSEESFIEVLTELHHSQVPKLSRLGILEYDQRQGDIRFGDPPDDLEPFLDLARSIETSD